MTKTLFVMGSVLLLIAMSAQQVFPVGAPPRNSSGHGHRFSGGNGTEENPYLISTVFDFEDIPNDPSAYYALADNIDLSSYSYYPCHFTGVLDGRGHALIDFYLLDNIGNILGLFSLNDGVIKNIDMINVYIYSDGSTSSYGGYNIGAIAAENWGTIENCTVSGGIVGVGWVGGIAGANGGNISNCTSYCNVTISDHGAGGIAGSNGLWSMAGIVRNCTTYGKITSVEEAGGIAGLSSVGKIEDCTSYCDISGVQKVGGIAGNNEVELTSCRYFGNVTGDNSVGGISGMNSNIVQDCYSRCKVIGNKDVGGVVGTTYIYSTKIRNCSSSSSVSGDTNIGGIAGTSNCDVYNCTSKGTISGSSYVGGIVGCQGYGTIDLCQAVGRVIGGDYTGGLTGRATHVAGSVSNCEVSGGKYVGGLVGSGGMTTNCTAFGNVTGTDNYIGGLTGLQFNDDALSSSAYGCVKGNGEVGGLVGFLRDGMVSMCTACGDVQGTGDEIGGLVGYNAGNVSNSSSRGNVSGIDQVGGLIGNSTYSSSGEYYVVSSSVSYGWVSGRNEVGGLIGTLCYTLGRGVCVTSCSRYGNVTGVSYVGGLVGKAEIDNISNCTSRSNVTGTGNYIGGMAGYFSDNEGKILSCDWRGIVSGGSYVGGLVGAIEDSSPDVAEITSCSAIGDVIGSGDYAGGLLGGNLKGWAINGQLKTSYHLGAVHGLGDYIGGLVGSSCFDDVNDCYAVGNITGKDFVGGLVGYNRQYVRDSYALGTVTGNEVIGGLVGRNGWEIGDCFSNCEVKGENTVGGLVGLDYYKTYDSYSLGTVQGERNVGGFAGLFDSPYGSAACRLSCCYSLSRVSASEGPAGGFCSNNTGFIADCYWDVNLSNISESDGGTGLSTAQMRQRESFSGWDFNTTWNMTENRTNPYLRWYDSSRPLITTTEILSSVYEKEEYRQRFNTIYEAYACDRLDWFVESDANWLEMDMSTGILTGTPGGRDNGTYNVTVSIYDQFGEWDSVDFVIVVIKVNDPPAGKNISYELDEDFGKISFNVSEMLIDPDDDPMAITFKAGDGINVTLKDGVVSLASVPDWNGWTNISFTGSDGEFSTESTVSVHIRPVNDPIGKIVMTGALNNSVIFNSTRISLIVNVSDPDLAYEGDTFSYIWCSNISGIIGLSDRVEGLQLQPGHHRITVTVHDKADTWNSTSIDIVVVKNETTTQDDDDETGESRTAATVLTLSMIIIPLLISLIILIYSFIINGPEPKKKEDGKMPKAKSVKITKRKKKASGEVQAYKIDKYIEKEEKDEELPKEEVVSEGSAREEKK